MLDETSSRVGTAVILACLTSLDSLTLHVADGTIFKIATVKKKDSAAVSRGIDSLVLLIAMKSVGVSTTLYLDCGLTVGTSFGKCVEFAMSTSLIPLVLSGRGVQAKAAGVRAAGSGSHRLALNSLAGPFIDPDRFTSHGLAS
ncbi:hypothetical protein [Cryobacterium sp. CG_9.6]|uniref:hypothetical protein n=1 Tax=Cryobacterium sp. CG_9.6 TaxID=2760710 RepID=UPI002475236F|nr:hypothetical protein [Cryobacterium sp. CG_9.6]MDH6236349.1 hypothetical protein [Cryobacterium sp. CG_9.6]